MALPYQGLRQELKNADDISITHLRHLDSSGRFRNLRKISDHLRESFGSLRVNFVNLRKSCGQFRMSGKLRVYFGKLRVWRVQFGINWHFVEYNLGLNVLFSSNQNPVILLSVL